MSFVVAEESAAPVWRGMDRAALDRAYDNSGAVAESGQYLAEWSKRTAALRAQPGHLLDLPYGPRERNLIDIYRCGHADAPMLVFIHGGYWQRNSKEIFGCMAQGPIVAGLDVALVGYTLAPAASLGEILAEVRSAISFIRQNSSDLGIGKGRLVISGWSAGGHLAVSAMDMAEVDAGLAISGIFDLEPILFGSLNDKLGLAPADVRHLSPIHNLPRQTGNLVVAYGTAELPELQRQSQDYLAAWQARGLNGTLAPIHSANHFSILEQLAQPDGLLARHAARLGGLS